MNQPEKLPSSTLLNRGEIKPILVNSGETVLVKVRLLPERHLNRFLDLREISRESELLEYVLQRNVALVDAEPVFQVVNLANEEERAAQAAFVDDIQSESFAELIEIADKLNFARAVSQAERQIATGHALLPMKKRFAETMMEPVVDTLKSVISSLTTQALSAAASKPPATTQSPG